MSPPPSTPPPAERGSLTRDAVIAEAVRVLSSEGMAALSIRTVATRLGVSPMALYRHIANKDDLLDEAVDLLFAARWEPSVGERDWQRWILDAADRLRRFLLDQPAALQVYLAHPVVAPTAVRRMDACLAVLTTALRDDRRAHKAYAAIQTYTIGFAALEAAREAGGRAERPSGGAPPRAESRRVRELSTYTSATRFRTGLGYLLHGIAG